MKSQIGLLVLVLAVLGCVTFLFLTLGGEGPFLFHSEQAEIEKFLTGFRERHRALREINFSALYSGGGVLHILEPMLNLEPLSQTTQSLACEPMSGSATKGPTSTENLSCGGALPTAFADAKPNVVQYKDRQIEEFLTFGRPLPMDFLVTPPFKSRSGASYADFLTRLGLPPYNNRTWVEQHLSFFKVSELQRVLSDFGLENSDYAFIARLADSEFKELIEGNSLILTRDFILFKNQEHFALSPLSYRFYDRRDLETELKQSRFDLLPVSAGALCLQKSGNLCWTYSSKHAMAFLYRYAALMLASFLLVFVIALFYYIRGLIQKNREQEKLRLSLQVLSHEFRTPVSSLLLALENLRSRHEHFSDADQDLMTRISADAYRLQRVIEISKNYLQVEGHRIHFKKVKIPSVNGWIADFINEADLPVETQLGELEKDCAIETDPFWLKFMLSNLLQNAISHGRAPICLRLRLEKGRVQFKIEDHGICEFQTLHQMTSAFAKSSRSNGMGLGLNIVKSIADELGCKFEFSGQPTAFALTLHRDALSHISQTEGHLI